MHIKQALVSAGRDSWAKCLLAGLPKPEEVPLDLEERDRGDLSEEHWKDEKELSLEVEEDLSDIDIGDELTHAHHMTW